MLPCNFMNPESTFFLKIKKLKVFSILVCLMLSTLVANASHIFGLDFYYKYVSGNTYTIYLAVYGDCSGAAFGSLSTSTPQIDIYNGNTYVTTINLTVQAPTDGVEVTPVCPGEAANTTCVNTSGTIPGVKLFIYSANYTVSGPAPAWRFIFEGNMGTGASAGRSNSITNILVGTAGSIIELTDTLNNTTYNNSSATFTTIATPFYCINQPANFNPGAVEPPGDSLRYYLVPAIDASTGSSVTYVAPYTATAPLAVATGTFSFSNSTGQLSFTPNAIQKSLVVYNVEEYRGGVLQGTSQREMTIVVLNTCTSSPPDGSITGATAGSVSGGGTELNICNNIGPFSFEINPTDAGSDITMTVSGLPTGATFNIVNNGTTAPLGTFTWNTTGVAPGTYTFYIDYQNNACPLSNTQTVAYTITVYPSPSEAVSIITPATCIAKAIFHVTPSGSFSPYTVSEIEGTTTIQTISGVTGMITDSVAAGTYIIRITNPDGCYADTTITITEPHPPTPSVAVTAPLCPEGSTGSATITGTGGLLPYTYAIGGGAYSSSNTFSGLSAGSYTLYIKDANGCIKDTTVTIPAAVPILANIYIASPLCNNFADGSVMISAYNSISPYTYAIGSGAYSSDSLFTSLAQGTYVFHIENGNGCIVDTSITLTDSIYIGATFTIANVLCNGGTGLIVVNGTGSATSYTYAYNTSPFSSSDTFILSSGTYTISVMDANSCLFDTSVSLTQPAPGIITPTINNVSCNGGNNGSIIVAASGGTPAYTYNISGGAFGISNTFNSLVAGTYTLQVEDANGCVYSDTVTVTQPTAIIIDSVSIHMPFCYDGNNGSVHVYATGGTPPYTYAEGTGAYATSATITGLSAGSNIIHVKDANGCIKDTTVTISQPSIIVPHAFVKAAVCNTLANGQVTLSASGGTPGYTYAIGSGSYFSGTVFTPLAAGTYTFSIKDANGCVVDTTINVIDSLHISATFAITPALCHDSASGVIIVNGIGGTSPYTYAIGTGVYTVTNTFTGLISANYNIHIKDNNGCIDDTSVNVGQPAAIVPHITITEPSCFGYNNAKVVVFASGGTPAYLYSLDNGSYGSADTFTSLYSGIDTIAIKDNNGCIRDTTFTIHQPTQLTISGLVLTNILCFGGSDGMVAVTASGATPPYFYEANGGVWQNSNVLTGMIAGFQNIQVKDNNGCIVDTIVTLTQPQPLLIASIDSINPTCQGYKDGAITFQMTGGTPPYQYSLDNITFSSSDSIGALAEGTYTFYIKDANGCSIDTTITFTGYPHILIDMVKITGTTCYGLNNGAAQIYANGGVGALSYQLNNNNVSSDTALFTDLYSGTYNIIVIDSKNCMKDTDVFVPQPAALSILLNITPNSCEGLANQGAIVADVTGGTSPYHYAWSSDSTNNFDTAINTNNISGLINATYFVTVRDSNDCMDADTGIVNFNNCCTPLIPNAFTPNGDGKDDIFRILYHGEMQVLDFSIYNRFGQRVFYTENIQNGWDGNFNGVAADIGVYYYFARIICGNSNNNITILKGDVTLIR